MKIYIHYSLNNTLGNMKFDSICVNHSFLSRNLNQKFYTLIVCFLKVSTRPTAS